MTIVPLGIKCDGCGGITRELGPDWEEKVLQTPDAPGFDEARGHFCPCCDEEDEEQFIEEISSVGVPS